MKKLVSFLFFALAVRAQEDAQEDESNYVDYDMMETPENDPAVQGGNIHRSDDDKEYVDYETAEADASGSGDDYIDTVADLEAVGNVFFNDEGANGITSILGFDEDAGMRGINDNAETTGQSVNDVADTLFRRANRRRKKKKKRRPRGPTKGNNKTQKKRVRLREGAVSILKQGLVTGMRHAEGCGRGWHTNGMMCANACRVAWLYGNPRKFYRADPVKFYQNNQKFTRCEACALMSGMVSPSNPSFFQKTLSNLKAGPPNFCKLSDPACKKKDDIMAACSGVDICADACWSPAANSKDCGDCFKSWCRRPNPDAERNNKFFAVCHKWGTCNKQYPPERYEKSDHRAKLNGQNCWGKPLSKELQLSDDILLAWTPQQVCSVAENQQYSKAYPTWVQFSNDCKKRVCNVQHQDYSSQICDAVNCNRKCVNTYLGSRDCMECRYEYPCKSAQCQIMERHVNCREACQAYADFRKAGTSKQDPDYKRAFDTCKGAQCFKLLSVKCSQCSALCESRAELSWTTELGTSHWKANFQGWGCGIDCGYKHTSLLAEFRGLDILDPSVRKFTKAFDSMAMGVLDEETVEALREYARKGKRLGF